MKVYGVRKFALVIGIACLPLAFGGAWLGRWCAEPSVPPAPTVEQPCGDALYRIDQFYHFGCDHRAKLKVNGNIAICECQPTDVPPKREATP